MLLEWIRRYDADFERYLKTYLFSEGSILAEEKEATAMGIGAERGGAAVGASGVQRSFTIGSLRSD